MGDCKKYTKPIKKHATNEQPAIGHGRCDGSGIGWANFSGLGAVFPAGLYCFCIVCKELGVSPKLPLYS